MNVTQPTIGKRVWFVCLLPLLLAGCGGAKTAGQLADEIPDDEPMRRMKWENEHLGAKKTPEVAARQYFLPRYYFDPGNSSAKDNPPNYLQGMDRVAVKPDAADLPDRPLWLQTPVFQLLDRADLSQPSFKVDDPVNTSSEILGRNTWMLWCGGNEGFWDWLASDSLGFIDLLKLVDSRQRDRRFEDGGVINEPRMVQSGTPDEFGVWLDVPVDTRTRQWQITSIKNDFEKILAGRHPSQYGLTRPDGSSLAAPGNAAGSTDAGPDYDRKAAEAGEYPPPEIYGYSSGVVGLRLFPNPNFTAEAKQKWDPQRYYDDPEYFNDPRLVRPYRVGVACAFCHASFHPLFPPRDVTNPSWENISGNIGAQYLRVRAVFANQLKPDNFIYHILDSQPPGTIDTSLIASDNINNPNTMNSVFNLPQRALMSFRNPMELQSDASRQQPAIWQHLSGTEGDFVSPFYRELFQAQGLGKELDASNTSPRFVPRVLLDGADSIGAWGALARVYLNIGTYYEQWIRLHRPVVGFKPQGAFKIADCERHSIYWHANQARVAALRDYFLNATPPMPLVAAAVGEQTARQALEPGTSSEVVNRISATVARHVDRGKLARGRKVFARNCIVCHSSIQPESTAVTAFSESDQRKKFEERYQPLIDRRLQSRGDVGSPQELWEHDPVRWLQDADYQTWAEEVVENEQFWRLNYLSNDYRIPITLLKTNSGRAMATNALDRNMWDDFASESYQHLPSVGAIDYFNPYLGKEGGMDQYTPRHKPNRVGMDGKRQAAASGKASGGEARDSGIPEGGGGPGYYRVPTLVSIWSTAPLLHNNSLGKFTNDPSVEGRLEAFDDAIRKLLWPERRLESSSYNGATAERLKRDHGLIWRTPTETYLHISGRRVPSLLASELSAIMKFDEKFPWLKEIRPLWLPSLILLMASFLLLGLPTAARRKFAGGLFVGISVVGALLLALFGWPPFVNPAWLPYALMFPIGLVFLSVDHPRALRTVALAALVVAVFGLAVYLLGGRWGWVARLNRAGPIGWLALLSGLGGLTLLLTGCARQWRTAVGGLLLAIAGVGFAVNVIDANLGGSTISQTMGPLWLYSLLLLAAALVVMTSDQRELTRYLGYSMLVLALTSGLVINFLAGRLGDVRLGPIPEGTPVNLLANLNPDADPQELSRALKITVGGLAEIKSKHLDSAAAQRVLKEKVAPALMSVSKCPDFVMDQGHDFKWFAQMTDDDKECLIELLKTF